MDLQVFRVAVIGNRTAIEHRAEACPAGSAERRLLDAVLAQYNGDVDGAMRLLRRQIHKDAPAESAPFADVLAPLLVMRHEIGEVRELAELLDAAGWSASATVFRALVAVELGDRENARKYARAAELLCEDVDDEALLLRLLQRLARVEYYLAEYDRALDLAQRSARLAERLQAWRAATGGYSIAFAIQHDVLEDFAEATRFALLSRRAAEASGDISLVQTSLVCEYSVAVQTGDAEQSAVLHEMIRTQLLPQQFTERYPLALAHAMFMGASDLDAMRSELQIIGEVTTRTRGQKALCTALEALAHAGRRDDDAARSRLRASITQLGRPLLKAAAHEKRLRLLTRATLAFTCRLLGDHVRAARILSSSDFVTAHSMLDLGNGEAVVRDSLRGMRRIFANAQAQRDRRRQPSELTPAELEVLKLLNHGWSAGRIARETNRSVNTVYNHTRAILGKLEASRAAEAVAIARQQGILA